MKKQDVTTKYYWYQPNKRNIATMTYPFLNWSDFNYPRIILSELQPISNRDQWYLNNQATNYLIGVLSRDFLKEWGNSLIELTKKEIDIIKTPFQKIDLQKWYKSNFSIPIL